jgi:hypothetical protein
MILHEFFSGLNLPFLCLSFVQMWSHFEVSNQVKADLCHIHYEKHSKRNIYKYFFAFQYHWQSWWGSANNLLLEVGFDYENVRKVTFSDSIKNVNSSKRFVICRVLFYHCPLDFPNIFYYPTRINQDKTTYYAQVFYSLPN